MQEKTKNIFVAAVDIFVLKYIAVTQLGFMLLYKEIRFMS